jgi:hypothetical protein
MNNRCAICLTPFKKRSPFQNADKYLIDCPRCGLYIIDGLLEKTILHDYLLNPIKIKYVAKISGWIREHQSHLIDTERYNKLLNLETPTVGEKATMLLKYLVAIYPHAGQLFNVSFHDLKACLDKIYIPQAEVNLKESGIKFMQYMAVSWSEDVFELRYILEEYLEKTKHYIRANNPNEFLITPDGWQFIDTMNKINSSSQNAFIAMWFSDKLKKFSEKWVEMAISDSGYNPLRIDKYPHTNIIDNEMISLIRQSKFMVADFTGNNNGVYYETGFARGLNIQVISL